MTHPAVNLGKPNPMRGRQQSSFVFGAAVTSRCSAGAPALAAPCPLHGAGARPGDTFGVSETCYRYAPKLVGENKEIADLLVGLTNAKRNGGFGPCFLYLRNVQGRPWNHKRVYRIYRELELNLRIKPLGHANRPAPVNG